MEELLARASRRVEEAEVFVVSTEEMPVAFEANRLKHIQSKQSITVALRVVKDGKIGYATTTTADDADDLIDGALATAEFGTEAQFTFPGATAFAEVPIFDPDTEAVSLEQMVDLAQGVIDRLTTHTADLMCEASVSRSTASIRILNSRGARADFKQTVFGIAVEGQLVSGTDMLFVGDHRSSCHPILDAGDLTEGIIHQLELAREHASVSTGALPVIFTPHGVASAFLRPLMAAFNGKTVLEGASPIGGKLGEVMFDTRLSLRDDPAIPFRPGSCPCDDEAVPSEPTDLIDAGRVAAFLYDLQTAGMAGTRSTGNGHRMQGGLPSPSPTSLVIGAGDTSPEEMLADIKEGLLVEQLMGASQGNFLGGDFSGNLLLGFKIEDGRIVGRVKDTMVSGNIYDILKGVAAFGSDARWVGGLLNCPSIYCPAVSVASK